jgi:hypothetical protein
MATRILGLDRLRRKLRRFPQVAREEISKAMEMSATEIVTLAKSLAQSDRVRDSIAWTWGDVPAGSMAIGRVEGPSGNLKITIYAGGGEAFMAFWEEFGTAPHINAGRFAGTQHPGTPARPYFFVSYRANRKRARGRITRSITKSVKRVAAGG